MEHAVPSGDRPPGLAGSSVPLCAAYDLALLDLDGVLYRGGEPVPDAADHLLSARSRGMELAYVTNNASRPPTAVAAQLQRMGLPATPPQVVTSAQAVAHLVAGSLPAGSAVLAVGGPGLVAALDEQGLRSVFSAEDNPRAVVQGYAPDLGWHHLCEAAIAVQRGVPWYAANTDRTIPTPRGSAPGNGTLVAAVAEAAGGWPIVAGKPEPALFAEAVRRLPANRPLVVGDRLDTDIQGANRFGVHSLLVLTGVTGLTALLAAPPGRRPSYVGRDLAVLVNPHPAPAMAADGARCAGWHSRIGPDGVLALTGDGTPDDAIRAVVAATWAHRDAGGCDIDASGVVERLGSPLGAG